jgi:acetyl-CoA C-acetyltransferase
MGEAYVIEACRTPRGVGKLGKGALSHLHPSYLGSTVLKAPAEHNELDTSQVDDVIWGTSAQVDKQGCDLGRIAALNAGYDVRTSGVTLDRFCGSGIPAVSLAAAQIRSGFEDCIVAGGTKMMSFTGSLSLPPLLDARNENLTKLHPQSQQGVCADAIATLEGISREGVDALAVESQKRAARAFDEGRFDRSLIVVRNPDGSVALER